MAGVFEGFAVIGVIVVVGYLLGRFEVLGEGARLVLNRFAFFVAAPALLFTVVAGADPSLLFSPLLAVSAASAVLVAGAYAFVARLVWRRDLGSATVGALASSYVNANNIGLPVAVYVLGDAAYTAPVTLLQLVVFAPIALLILDTTTRRIRLSPARSVLTALRNPIVVGTLLGLAVSVAHVRLPAVVLEPVRLLGGAAVPLMLTGFGMSLAGARPLGAAEQRRDVLLATALKLLVMPAVALALGLLVRLPAEALHAAVVLAALPTAQNVLTYAVRYGVGTGIARDVNLLTTVGAIPVLVVVSALLAPG